MHIQLCLQDQYGHLYPFRCSSNINRNTGWSCGFFKFTEPCRLLDIVFQVFNNTDCHDIQLPSWERARDRLILLQKEIVNTETIEELSVLDKNKLELVEETIDMVLRHRISSDGLKYVLLWNLDS